MEKDWLPKYDLADVMEMVLEMIAIDVEKQQAATLGPILEEEERGGGGSAGAHSSAASGHRRQGGSTVRELCA